MELSHEVELISGAAQFIYLTSDYLALIRGAADEGGSKDGAGSLKRSILEQSSSLKYALPEDAGLLTEKERALFDVHNACHTAARLVRNFDDSTPAQKDGTAQGLEEALETQISETRSQLNDTLAPILLAEIDLLLRDTHMKNIRLSLARWRDSLKLKTDIQTIFNILKARTPSEDNDAETSSIWLQILTIVRATVGYSAEQAILGDLYFATLTHREELISKEHENTFSWIFEENMGRDGKPAEAKEGSFMKWLTNEQSIYWVSGKPGSGKSTLLKYLSTNEKTTEVLKSWAGDDRLFTASYYFWSSAKDSLQKSDTGLLRSILFQMLAQCPELIPHAFPEQWKLRHSGSGAVQRFVPGASAEDFIMAFQRITTAISGMSVKFCLFIDGLDEFEGNMPDIITLVETLSKAENIKACLSSRQWKEFEEKFGGDNPWKMYIHELTTGDMRAYIDDILRKDEIFTNTRSRADSKEVDSFISDLVSSAQGVFLWVFLVLHALMEDLSDKDTVTDLRSRLSKIPHDLDGYFQSLILSIPSEEQVQSSRLFLTTLSAASTLPLMNYYFLEHTILDHVLNSVLQPMSEDNARETLHKASTLLHSRCKGLLKVNSNTKNGDLPILSAHNWLFDFRVDFLHRTVTDFLKTPEMLEFLGKRAGGDFNVDLGICRATLATIKTVPPEVIDVKDLGQALSTLHLFFSHEKRLDGDVKAARAQEAMLDSMIFTLREYDEKRDGAIKFMLLGPGNYWASEASFDFIILYHCISYGLGTYALSRIRNTNSNSKQLATELSFSEPPDALLSGILSRDTRFRPRNTPLDLASLKLLLDSGLSPNVAWGDRGFSFWQQLVNSAYGSYLKGTLTDVEYDAIRVALDHGAEKGVEVEMVGSRGLDNITALGITAKIMEGEKYLI